MQHPIFGVGTVLTMEESGECRVAFNGGEFSLRRSALRWEVEEGEGGSSWCEKALKRLSNRRE